MSINDFARPLNPAFNTNLNVGVEKLKHLTAQSSSLGGKDRSNELRKATQEFEALFVGYLLRVMRSTVDPADEESETLGKGIYMEMFDQEIALHIARNRSLGIGEMMFRQLVGNSSPETGSTRSAVDLPDQPTFRGVMATEGKSQEDSLGLLPGISVPPPDRSGQNPSHSETEDFNQPVEGVSSSPFGLRKDPFSQRIRFHHGVDVAAPAGMNIHAAQAGTVVFSGILSGYGNTVILEHQDGYRTLYAHAAQNLVAAGDVVNAGQVIGLVGSSGHSTGPHLHFELQKDGEVVDPGSLLKESSLLSLAEKSGPAQLPP